MRSLLRDPKILKVSPTTSTIKEPGKPVVTVRNSDIAKFVTQLERQTPLKAYANRRGPRSGEKTVEELIHSHIKKFTRKQKGDKKNRRREPGSGVLSTKSNISRAMRGRIPKKPNFSAMRNQPITTSLSEQHASTSTAPTPAPLQIREFRSHSSNSMLLWIRNFPTKLGYPASTKATPPSGRCGKLCTTRHCHRVSATNR